MTSDAGRGWTVPEPPELADGPLVGDDRPILEAFLAWERNTLLAICAGLTAEQLARRAAAPSNLSLLGLLRHLAKVERLWFRIRAAGEGVPPLFDPALGKDHDYDELDPADAPEALATYLRECELADAAAAALPFDHEFDVGDERYSLRFVYVHMIAEYARHNGHADIVREHLDGVTGR